MGTFCKYFDHGICGSCRWIETNYNAQIRDKETSLRTELGLPSDFILEPAVKSPVVGFRNRAKLSVSGTPQAPIVGLLGSGDLDQGRELLFCPIHHPKLNELIAEMPGFIAQSGLIPYQIANRSGDIKGLIMFYSPLDQIYLRFVLRSKSAVPFLKSRLPELLAKFPAIKCVSANIQPIPHAVLEGREEVYLTECRSLDYRVSGPKRDFTLKLSPQAFVQTNSEVATTLYKTAATWIAESGSGKMAELYCGQGAFSFTAADSILAGLGVEVNPEAVATANATAVELGIAHLKFVQGDATTVDDLLSAFSPDLILVNPPRRGLGEAMDWMIQHRPAHFIYSSCEVSTLAFDLRRLQGYRIRRAGVFDLFPHTQHYETLVWLERLNLY